MAQERRVILITGSSRGIGAYLAQAFAAGNDHVVINHLASEAQAHTLLSTILQQQGPEAAVAFQADVSQRADVTRLFDAANSHFGRVDVLINMAGINRDAPFLEMTDAQWTSVMNTILTGTFFCSQEFARRYQGDDGHIINIGALTAVRGRKNGANYCAARAGVLTLTKCLALELAPRIRVNCVTPGWINTDEVMERYQLNREENFEQAVNGIPMRRLGTPEDVFRMVEFLVNTSSYVTGHNFFVDGGYLFH